MLMSKKTIALSAVALLALWILVTFCMAYFPDPIRIQGQIDAQQYNISSKVPGRINRVFVKKGDLVKRDELIFTLLSPEIDAKMLQAEAGQKAAGALANQAQEGARIQQVTAAKDQWRKAQAAGSLLNKTYMRVDSLFNDGVISEQKRDEAYTKWQAARYTESAAYQMYQMASEGARIQTKVAAKEKENMAAGAVAEVQAYVDATKVKSWHNGEVSQVLLERGELAPQGFPVVSIIDMQDAWAVFNIREDLLNKFKKGMNIQIKIPALSQTSYKFQISHISVMGDFATWRTTDTSKGFDMRTFEVEARPMEPIEGLRVGMSALIE